MWSDDTKYSRAYWKRLEKFIFFYPLWDVWEENKKFRKWMIALLFGLILWIGYTLYIRNYVPLDIESFSVLLLAVGVVFSLIVWLAIIFVLIENIKFKAEMFEQWITIQEKSFSYWVIKDVKFLKCEEEWNEYIKIISTDIEDKILTKNILYNPKIEKVLEKIQESFEYKWIKCERIIDAKNLDISDETEYEVNFWFLKVWKLLSWEERFHRIKNISIFIFVYLIFAVVSFVVVLLWWGEEDITIRDALQPEKLAENFNFWISFYSLLLVVLVVFLTIHFILSVRKFYARIENNMVYIHNGYWGDWFLSSSNFVLSKIKVNYWFIMEWNVEGIMLTINNWEKIVNFKRPRHEKVERFCSNLSDEVKKRKNKLK